MIRCNRFGAMALALSLTSLPAYAQYDDLGLGDDTGDALGDAGDADAGDAAGDGEASGDAGGAAAHAHPKLMAGAALMVPRGVTGGDINGPEFGFWVELKPWAHYHVDDKISAGVEIPLLLSKPDFGDASPEFLRRSSSTGATPSASSSVRRRSSVRGGPAGWSSIRGAVASSPAQTAT